MLFETLKRLKLNNLSCYFRQQNQTEGNCMSTEMDRNYLENLSRYDTNIKKFST